MGVMLFIGGIGIFLMGFVCGGMTDFDWKAYYDYKLKLEEMNTKQVKGGAEYGKESRS